MGGKKETEARGSEKNKRKKREKKANIKRVRMRKGLCHRKYEFMSVFL